MDSWKRFSRVSLAVAVIALFVVSVMPTGQSTSLGVAIGVPARTLDDLFGQVAARVPPGILGKLQRIELTIRTEILPHLDGLPLGAAELYLIERTVSDYLPTAIDAYLRLPSGYVSSQPGSHGRAALDVLAEELDFLDAEMREVAAVVHRTDMDRLLAHKRFLVDRFRREDTSSD